MGLTRVRWGILGVSKIATAKVVPAMRSCRFAEVTALASRDRERAATAARALGIPKSYGAYDDLLDDGDIDAVYIPLPNHLHVPWSIRAAEAGKHVLCEKPIAMSATEARLLLDVRDRTSVLIQEAFMIRTHPQWLEARDLVGDGRIGELRSMLGHFSYHNDDPRNIRNIPAFGGGGLMDIGCYLINTSRFIFGREPSRVSAAMDRDPALGVDRMTSLLMDFDVGHFAGTCSTQIAPYQRMQIFGTRGHIEIDIPFNAPAERACRIVVDSGSDSTGGGVETIELAVCDQYTIQADLFSQAVLNGGPAPTPLEDAVRNMACIDAVFRAAETGRWETPGVT